MQTNLKVNVMKTARILITFALLSALAACGSSSKSNTTDSKAASTESSSETEQESVNPDTAETGEADTEGSDDNFTEEDTGLVFGDLDQLGNNPNNLDQCSSGIAFDDKYIYFADKSTGNLQNNSISRVRYDGTGYEVLPIEDSNTVSSHSDGGLLLNVKDGYLYYLAYEDGNSNIVKRYNIATGDCEPVMTSDANPAEITNMLVVNNYLYVVTDCNRKASGTRQEKSVRVDVCNLDTFDTLTIFNKDKIAGTPIVTSDGKNVYLSYYTSKNKLYRVDVDKIDAYFKEGTIEEEYSENVSLKETSGSFGTGTVLFAKNGLTQLHMENGQFSGEFSLTGINYSGESHGTIGGYAVDLNEYTYSRAQRFFTVGGNFILLAVGLEESTATSDDIYDIHVHMFYDMDRTTSEVVYASKLYWDSSMFGIHDDKLFMIGFERESGPMNLITIDAEGQVSTVSIS